MFVPPPGSHICFLYFCAGCSTAFVLMELVSFLGPSLLLMFLLLVSSVFAVSLTILFLLGVLPNIAVRWISLTEYLSNKLSNVFYRWLLLEFITTVFFFLRVTLQQEIYFVLVLVGLREPELCVICFQFMFGFFLLCLAFSPSSKLLLPPLFMQMVLN